MNSLILIVAKPFMRIHPNILTIIGLVFPFLFFYFMVEQNYFGALVSLSGVLFDTIDGAVARQTGRVTAFGGVLDSTIDRIADSIYIISFYYADLTSFSLTAGLLITSYLISYIRSRAELAGKGSFKLDVGMIERSERMLLVLIAVITAIVSSNFVEHILLIMLILSLLTVFQRLVYAERSLRSME